MTILDLCAQPTAYVSMDATAAEAIRVMLNHHVGAVAIIDDIGQIIGIFTERDVLVKVALSGRNPSNSPVRELMTSPARTATSDVTPVEALRIMIEGHFRHLPIVSGHGKLLGILSVRNLLQWRTDDLSHELDALEQYFANDSLGG
ncbi:MAG TPA: CBS domain-containing protein [Terriglobales bacterium]|nr:CBS domain-containing protein [Terriglobales bacterium]